MFSIGEDILRDIREERHDLRGIVIASDDISSLGEGYGDIIDRADLLSILCFAGYLCPNMCDFFTDYAGNDQGDIELAMWVLGGGSSGLSPGNNL